MANGLVSLFLTFNLLFIISVHGRVFQTNNAASISDIQGKLVSLQATGSFNGTTNADDAQGLMAILAMYPTLEETNPDPCLPPVWTWITCNSDARPRIITLDLSQKGLLGVIPVFSSMIALQKIDLSQNYLYGDIPPFIGTFSNLQELNVANNYFTGTIPDSIACNKKLKIRAAGNYALYVSNKCTGTGNIVDTTLTPTTTYTPTTYTPTTYTPTTYTPTPYTPTIYTYRRRSRVGAIAGSISGIFLLISIGVGIFAIFRHKAKTAAAIAAANAGTLPNDQKTNMPGEEMPMNSRPPNMSPQP